MNRPRRRLTYVAWLLFVASALLPAPAEPQRDIPIPITFVTPKDILENEPFCGRVLPADLKIPPSPALNTTSFTINVPAKEQFLIDNVRVRAGDGPAQPATGPICFDNIQVLQKPAQALYGSDAAAGAINFKIAENESPRPKDRVFYDYSYFTSPVYIPGEIQTFRGPFNGKADTSVEVNGQPGQILAETPRSLYWMLPDGTASGSITVVLREGPLGFKFPVTLLGLSMSADQLHLLRGQSTRLQATVFGPESLPESSWRAGEPSDTLNLGEVKRLFPDFKIPKPGEPATLFFRIDNASRDVVSMSPSKNESYITELDRGDFSGGPYKYDGTVRSKKAGSFQINSVVVAFFELMQGTPLPAQVAEGPAQTPTTPTPPAPPPSTPAQPGTVTTTPTETTTRPCQKSRDKCEELRRRAEQLEAEASAARQNNAAASDQLFQQSEAEYLEQSAANDRAYAAKLREQAAAYRELAANNRADAARNRQRAQQWPPGHEYRRGWEEEAAHDDQRAAEYDAEAERLEAEAAAVEAAAAAKSTRAGQLREGLDPDAVRDLEAKIKAAADARAAYEACLRELEKEACPAIPEGKFSVSLGFGYKWDRPTVGLDGWSVGGTTTGTKPPPEEPPQQPGMTPPQKPIEDTGYPACEYRVLDGWFEPSQGVWQDDPIFEDRPGKQLTRVDVPDRVSYIAELPMVKGRDTVLVGVHHYLRSGARVEVDKRHQIVLKGESNCTEYDAVRFKFTVQGPGQGGTFVHQETRMLPLRGRPSSQMTPFEFSILTFRGLPEDHTLKFGAAGPYTILAELIRTDGSPTGLEMRVSGNAVETTGPLVHFIPVKLSAGSPAADLTATAQRLATESTKFIPDFFPLAPGALPTRAVGLHDFTAQDIPAMWEFFITSRREDKLASLLQDRLGTGAFLTGAGRVVAILDDTNYDSVRGTGSVAATSKSEFTVPDKGITLSYKVILARQNTDVNTVAHELVHSLPGLWSSPGMVAECGKDYHNKDTDWAHGIRLVAGGTPADRRPKNGDTPIMGPSSSMDENMADPFVGEGISERPVRDPATGQEKMQFFFQLWITQCTYGHLANVLTTPPDPPMLLVRGYLGRKASTYGAHFNAFYDLMGFADLPQDFMGDFAIVLKDAAGQQLAVYRFNADWSLPDAPLTRDLTAFAYRVPMLPGLAQIDLLGPDGVLASRRLSAQPPKVNILSPVAGASLAPEQGKVRMAWSASGEPGATLLSTVLYSNDGGKTFEDVLFESKETSFALPVAPGVKEHVVKVIVTDGSRSSEAVVRFTTP